MQGSKILWVKYRASATAPLVDIPDVLKVTEKVHRRYDWTEDHSGPDVADLIISGVIYTDDPNIHGQLADLVSQGTDWLDVVTQLVVAYELNNGTQRQRTFKKVLFHTTGNSYADFGCTHDGEELAGVPTICRIEFLCLHANFAKYEDVVTDEEV